MKQLLQFIIAFTLTLAFTSCEKVIDLDLNSSEKEFVIEGNLSNQPGTCRVLVSKTKDFSDNNSFAGIGGAMVSITEVGGPTTLLTETTPGVYEDPTLAGTSGEQYVLKVIAEGQEFTAACTVPSFIPMDRIYTTSEFLFDEAKLIVNIDFTDPPGKGNNYRFIQYFNNRRQSQLQFMNDDYTDGRIVNAKLFYFNDDDDEEEMDLKSGDEVRVEMYNIDPVMYKYWFSLSRSATGDSNQATPANPVGNISGGALGYFSAHTMQTKTMTVP